MESLTVGTISIALFFLRIPTPTYTCMASVMIFSIEHVYREARQNDQYWIIFLHTN